MRVSCFFVSVLFIFAEGAKDKPFGQVFSKQQKFLSSFSSSSSSLSFLPFSNVLDALYDPNGYCFVAISSDDDNKSALWSAKKSLKGVGEEVYSDWRAVDNGEGASFPAGEMFSKIVKAPDSILLISSSSIYEIVLDFNCTHVTSVNVLLTPVEEWGEVLSASFANINFGDGQSNPSLWIGTEQGLFLFSQFRQESHDVWETIKFQEINERVSSLLWVQEWNQCFVGTPVALYDISIQSKGTTSNDISYKMQYQWIGGNIDTEAKNMVYDSSFDCVWLVQQEALHQRRSDGTWYRQGHYQGLITNNLSSVAVTTQGIGSDNTTHFVWLGSKNRGLLRRQIRQPMTEEGGNEDTGQEDGVPVTDATFRDQFVLLYFGFTFCPDICPNEINKVTEVMNEIGDQNSFDTKPVFVTIDPNRDTIGQLKYYSQDFDPRFTWLTGPSSQIQEIAKSYRVFTGKVDEGEEDDGDYLVDHSSFMYLIDPSGECIDFYGKSQHVEDIARSINRHMRKYSGKGKGT